MPWVRRREREQFEQKLLLEQERFGKVIVLVYTMGKVGSRSVYDSLRAHLEALPVAHAHFLSDHWVNGVLPSLHRSFRHNIQNAEEYRRRTASLPDHRLKVITLVRDPVARELSNIFENWQGLFRIRSIDDLSLEMITSYVDQQPQQFALEWFDSEFKGWTDVDVYSLPFDRRRAYEIYETERFDLLVIKLEGLDACFTQAIGQFLGVDGIELVRSNETASKDGKTHYRELTEKYRATEEKLNELYASRLVTHFYSDAEIAAFRGRWLR